MVTMAQKCSWWLPIIFLQFFIISGTCESLLCGPTQELELQYTGRSSAVSLTLANREGNSSTEPCALNIFAPEAYALAFRIIDTKDFDETYLLNMGWKSNIPGHKKSKFQPPECTLQIYNMDSKKSNKKGSGLKVSPCSPKHLELEMLPPPVKVEWWPPRPPNNTNTLRLIVTAVNTGVACDGDDQVVCLRAGEKPLLCVSEALTCDGVRHCPEGAQDENLFRCGNKHFTWIEHLVRRVISKHGDFLDIDETQFTPERNVTNTTVPAKKKSVIAAFESALAPYGPWAHMLVGTFICAMAVALFSLWECLCHRTKPSQEPIPPECEAPAAVVLETPRCSSRPTRTSRTSGLPPSYDTIETPPPSYNLLFPQASNKPTNLQTIQEASTSSNNVVSAA